MLVVGTETVQPNSSRAGRSGCGSSSPTARPKPPSTRRCGAAEPGWTGPVPIGVPDPNTAPTCSTQLSGPCRSASRASCTSAGAASRAGTSAAPASSRERFVADPFGRARAPHVPHRRPRALARRRRAGLPRPRRRPGEDPRPPHRARRDRGGAPARPGHRAGRGHRARGPPGTKRLVAYAVARAGAPAPTPPRCARSSPASCRSTWSPRSSSSSTRPCR